jgi:MFS family permease
MTAGPGCKQVSNRPSAADMLNLDELLPRIDRRYISGERLDGQHRMKSHYRWVIVAAGGLLGCVAVGAMFSLPVFLRAISRDTGWSITGVSSAMTFGFLAMALGSIVWGNLSDRFGPRLIVLAGSGVLAAALALTSRATSLIEFQLIFGLVVGGGSTRIAA